MIVASHRTDPRHFVIRQADVAKTCGALAKIGACSLDRETAAWVANLGDDLHAKLAVVSLVSTRSRMNLGSFLDGWLKKREGAKPNSLKNYKQAIGKLQNFFGCDINLQEIAPTKAEDWMIDLCGKHAKATAGRILKFARQYFKAAVRDKILVENPFADIKAPAQTNEARKFFVAREVTQQVLDACHDAEWRLIVALCRFGGLPCPSELLVLKLCDVNWEKSKILVHAPKTEHHEDGGDRFIPIFPELRPYLEKCFELASPGPSS